MVRIDQTEVFRKKDGNLIFYVCGWTGEEPDFQLYADGQKKDFKIERLEREDVQSAAASKVELPGFRLRADLDGSTQEVKLLNGDKQAVRIKPQSRNPQDMILHVDVVECSPGLIVTGGWIFSAYPGDIDIKVTNSKGVEIKQVTVIDQDRPDVKERFMIDEETVRGFNVQIYDTGDNRYTITASQNGRTIEREVHRKKQNMLAKITPARIAKGWKVLQEDGLQALVKQIRAMNTGQVFKDPAVEAVPFQFYHEWFMLNRTSEEELERQRNVKLEKNPKISLIVAAYNTPEKFLEEMVRSVQAQTYTNWELCIADGSDNDTVRKWIEANPDERIKYTRLEKNAGIAANMNAAAKLATGDYIALFDHDDTLEPDLLFEVASAVNEKEYAFIYTDEDKFDQESQRYCEPHLKPDFSPDLLRTTNYICHFLAIRKDAWEKAGPLRSEFDGAQDYDLVLRLMEQNDAADIKHIAKLLYHWRRHAASTAKNPESKTWAYDAGAKALSAYMERNHLEGPIDMIWPGIYFMQQKIQGDPMVSIIIPSKDHIDDLKKCVESLYKVNTWKNFEVIIVENNSDKQETFDYYKKIEKKYPNLKVLYWKDEFNYSAINNFGEKEAKGDYILLLNNDTEILEPDSIKEMVRRAQMPKVGAVGAKLYYPDDTIQHYGVTIGIGGVAGHPFSREQDKNLDNYLKISVHNVSAATAACLLIPKAVFDEINGLDEKLKVAFNDVDLCLRIRQKGYWIVQTPHAKLYHYESKSRGQDISEENRKRFDSEKRFMMDRWGKEILGGDPFYNRNFSYYGGEHLLRQKDEIHPAVHLQHYLEELDAKEKQENQSE